MSQKSPRIEPTFGRPSSEKAENQTPESPKTTETPKNVVSPFISISTKSAPKHTFSKPLMRPEESENKKLIADDEALNFSHSPQKVAPIKIETAPIETAINNHSEIKPQNDTILEPNEPEVSEVKPIVADEPIKVQINEQSQMERVIPQVRLAEKNAQEPKENNEAMPKVPSKYRRFLLVIIALLLLGLAAYLLKPSVPKSVQELQDQPTSNLPIEFRPVNEEEAKAAEAREALLKQQQAEQQAQAQQNQVPAQPEPIQPTEPVMSNNTNEVTPTAPVVEQPVVVNESHPTTSGSVIYQPENKIVEEPLKPTQPAKKVEKIAEKPVKIKAITEAELKAKQQKNAQLDQLIKNVEAGKPAVAKTQPKTEVKTNVANDAVASKTMVVPKSTSLMQVFRDNNLNISDVNAMSRASNVVSNLKVNEKVTVKLDKNRRVVEMSLGSGGKFIRQADGSYQFK